MNIIEQALQQTGDDSGGPLKVKRLQGGEINNCFLVKTKQHSYVIKYHSEAPVHFFKREADGLAHIRSTHSVATPDVYSYRDEIGASFIVMEWIDNVKKTITAEEALSERIAALHDTHWDMHGYPAETYVGMLRQPNGLYRNWLAYYRDQRLSNQLDIGVKNDRITGKRRNRLEKLLAGLDKWVPSNVPASFLHGDLWGQNWLLDKDGIPYVIDPSFLYGDRHFELAYMELFGRFSNRFFEVYHSAYPVSDTYHDVKPIYQLYYLLVHLNIFGEIYGPRIDDILKRFVPS